MPTSLPPPIPEPYNFRRRQSVLDLDENTVSAFSPTAGGETAVSRRLSIPVSAAALAERRASLRVGVAPSPLSTTSARRGSAVAIPFTSSLPPSTSSPFSASYAPVAAKENDLDVLPSSPGTSDDGKDPLLQLTASSLRRSSFLLTSATTQSKSSVPSLPSPVRRLVILALGAASLFALFSLLSPTPLPRTLSNLRPSSNRFHGLTSARVKQASRSGQQEENVRDLEHLLDLIARSQIVAAGERLPDAQPDGESRHLLKRLTSSMSGSQLVLSNDELKEVKSVRQQLLWGTGEAELETAVIEVNSSLPHLSTVIYIHGLAQHVPGDGIIPNALFWKYPNTRWVMPQAPLRNISLFSIATGKKVLTPGFFDMHTIPYDTTTDHDDEAFFISTRQLNVVVAKERARLIQTKRGDTSTITDFEAYGTEEEKAWASKRIVLSGFSQGGAMSLLVGLTHKYELGGLAVISTVLPLREYMSRLTYDLDRTSLPLYWGHGTSDPYLTYSDALTCVKLLSPTSPSLASAIQTSESQLLVNIPTNPTLQLGLTDVQFSAQPGLPHAHDQAEIDEIAVLFDKWLPTTPF